jgi:hypothetical protein
MKKPFLLFPLFLSFFLVSCLNSSKEVIYDLTDSPVLSIQDTIFRFEDKLAMAIAVQDSTAYIIQDNSDTCMLALNLKTKKMIKGFGFKGSGPEDLVSPEFMPSLDNSNAVFLVDVNSKKLLSIKNDGNKAFHLKKLMPFPAEIFPASNLNYSNQVLVGRQLKIGSNKMFFIYDQKKHTKVDVSTNPDIPGLKDPNYFCAPQLALNAAKHKIIVGMYYMDMFHLYDLDGKHIKSFCFSKDFIPPLDKKGGALDLIQGFKGIYNLFPTDDFCYLMRVIEKPVFKTGEVVSTTRELFLVQVDWDGKLISSYRIKDELGSRFCVDEKQKKLFAIRHTVESTSKEFYDVVTYSLR